MKTSVERLEDNRAKLITTLSPEEVDQAVEQAYAEAAESVRIKGFRKGKAPREVIDLHVGQVNVLTEARRDAIAKWYPVALDDADLRPLGNPKTSELSPMTPGQEFSFEVELTLRPEMELTGIDGFQATVPPLGVGEDLVDAYLEDLRDRFSELKSVQRELQGDDLVSISFVGFIDGEHSEDSTVYEHLHHMGRGLMPEEFESGILGSKPGDETHIEFPIPDTASDMSLVGKMVAFDVTVHEVLEKSLPEIDADFAEKVGGFDTVEELREDILARISERQVQERKRMIENQARRQLVERMVGDIPQSMFDERGDEVTKEFSDEISSREMSFDDYLAQAEMTREQLLSDINAEAELRVREDLAFDALGRKLGLTASDEEVEAEIAEACVEQKMSPEAMREFLRERGGMSFLRGGIVRRSAFRWLIDHVEITEEVPEGEAGSKKAAKKPAKKAPKSSAASAEETAAPKKGTSAKMAPKKAASKE